MLAYVRFSSSISVVLFSSRSIHPSIYLLQLPTLNNLFLHASLCYLASFFNTLHMEICQFRKKEKKISQQCLTIKLQRFLSQSFLILILYTFITILRRVSIGVNQLKHISLPKQNNFNNQKHF